MLQPPRLSRSTFSAIVLVLVFALFVEALLQRRLQEIGYPAIEARDRSVFVVPLLLWVMLWPVCRPHAGYLIGLFSAHRLTASAVFNAIAIGLWLRLAWWSQLVAGIAFGWTGDETGDKTGVRQLSIRVACPNPGDLALGLVGMAVLVPLSEELVHRGLIQSGLLDRGRCFAVVVSALVFAVFHDPSAYPFAFLSGIVLGVMLLQSGALWAPLIAHATYNTAAVIDWRCLSVVWYPDPAELPLPGIGAAAVLILSTCVGATVLLLGSLARSARRSA